MKVRKISVTAKIILLMSVLLLVGLIILGGLLYTRTQSMLVEQIKQRSEELAACAAASLDAEAFARIGEGDEGGADYAHVYSQLALILNNSSLEYVYSLRLTETGAPVFVVDTDPDDPCAVGQAYEMSAAMETAFSGAAASDAAATTDDWGTHISSYSPILLNGSVVGVVGVDVNFGWIQQQTARIAKLVSVTSLIILFILMVAVSLVGKRLKASFTKLNEKICSMADGTGDLHRRMDITSGDEFEVIGGSINALIEQVGHLVGQVGETTTRNTNTITELNNSIIQLSANMEECSATGEIISTNLSDSANRINTLVTEVSSAQGFAETAHEDAKKSSALATQHHRSAEAHITQIQEKLAGAAQKARGIERIKKVAEDIDGFVLQTKLLSFNAQIEASYAGKSGEGFAVVANSVGALSESIGACMAEINDVNETALLAVNDLITQADELRAFLAGDVLADYAAFAKMGSDFGASTDSIRENMEHLKLHSDEIAHTINDVDLSIKEITAAVTNSAVRIEELSSSSSDIAASMEELLHLPMLSRR